MAFIKKKRIVDLWREDELFVDAVGMSSVVRVMSLRRDLILRIC